MQKGRKGAYQNGLQNGAGVQQSSTFGPSRDPWDRDAPWPLRARKDPWGRGCMTALARGRAVYKRRSDANWVLANGGVCIRSYLHHFYNLFFINLRAQKNREEQMHFVFGWRSCNNAIRVYGYAPVAVPPLWLRESSRKVGTAKYDFIFINMISFL